MLVRHRCSGDPGLLIQFVAARVFEGLNPSIAPIDSM
jgi:hypothetical protein